MNYSKLITFVVVALHPIFLSAQTDTLKESTPLKLTELYSLEAEMGRDRLFLVVFVCFILFIFLCISIYSYLKLKRTNTLLCRILCEYEDAKKSIEEIKTAQTKKAESKEKLLFNQLNSVLNDEKMFMNPKIGRKELAAQLGTNTTYLVDSIKICADGATVSEYVNQVRLKYACQLLIDSPKLSIDEVSENCGFSSRSTFFRLFRKYYGMSPVEFVKVSCNSK